MLKIQKIRNKYDCIKSARILVDPDLIVLLINKKALDILEADKKNIIGNNILLYLPNEIRFILLPKIKKLLRGINNKFIKKSEKNNKNSRFKIFLIREKNRQIKIYIEEIRKKNQDQSLTNTRLSDLSHELRAPLFNIRSFLETLYEYDNQLTSEQRLEFLEIATTETNRLNNLVKNILDFAELDNQKNYIISQSSLNRTIDEVVQINQLTAINKKIILIKSVNINNQKVVSHYSSLTRILSNLLNNAIKFTYPKGIISITTKNLQSKFLHQQKVRSVVKISIVDTGIGISKQDNKNIFNRFSRGNKKTHLITGSGLGLPIVKEILSKHNQTLNLLSHIKKGSQASFTLNAIK